MLGGLPPLAVLLHDRRPATSISTNRKLTSLRLCPASAWPWGEAHKEHQY